MEASYLFWGLLAMFLLIFWRIGKQIIATYRHLDEWELRDFKAGRSKNTSIALGGALAARYVCTQLWLALGALAI